MQRCDYHQPLNDASAGNTRASVGISGVDTSGGTVVCSDHGQPCELRVSRTPSLAAKVCVWFAALRVDFLVYLWVAYEQGTETFQHTQDNIQKNRGGGGHVHKRSPGFELRLGHVSGTPGWMLSVSLRLLLLASVRV